MTDESLYPSAEASTILRAAGWSPDERMDVSHWVEALVRDGHHVFPTAKRILELYGGLQLENKMMGGRSCHDLRMHPAYGGERDRLELIEEILHKHACPLGGTFGGAMLAVVEDGMIITDYDGDIVQIGDSWRAALDRIVLGQGQDYIQLAEDYEPVKLE